MIETYLENYGASVVGGALFLAAAWFFAIWLDRGIRHLLIARAGVDSGMATVLARTIRISIWVLAGVAVLEELGVEVASLIAALGIFGFAIAIGLRTTANNFFTGVMLFILRPYKVGDYIDGERVEGVVESMSLFHTVLVTDDGTYVAVPNGAMWSRSVKNFSRPRPRRIEIEAVVDRAKPFEEYGTLIDKALRDEEALVAEFPPLVLIADVSEDSLTVRISAWCDVQNAWDARQRLSASLRDILTAAGVVVRSVGSPKRTKKKKKKSSVAVEEDD